MNTHALKILAVSLGLCAAAGHLVAQVTETMLHSFTGSPDGYQPRSMLLQGSDGNFYGTTLYGGTNGTGTVYRISPDGSETILHTFDAYADDGGNPAAGLVLGSDGNFYGTVSYGGTNLYDNQGTVFLISPNGSEATVCSFGSSPYDGINPNAGLVLGSDGNFYGTTYQGGTNSKGTVFRVSLNGNRTTLYSFGSYPHDGVTPSYAALVQGSDSNFYGTTLSGGTSNAGTIFRISPSGSYTNLYSFGGYPTDGGTPEAGLVQGSDGDFYGTTASGGLAANNDGTIFRISPSGSYTILYSFVGYLNYDGVTPWAGLVQGSDGNFYGTTLSGGTSDQGTVFRISPSGSYTNLYSFVGYPTDGGYPATGNGLVQGSDDSFYGTTSDGGTNGTGAVFKLTVPLNSPANRISAIKVAGANVLVTIPAIAGETYQLQDRTSLTAGAWADVAGQVISIGGLLTVTNFGGFSQPQQFYRFSIIP
jgi:uncharacterized repeat protein (TIGR03803 family)